jgi:hypothetical protein
MQAIKFFFVCLLLCGSVKGQSAQNGRDTLSLNGNWQFDQTENAFPPAQFTRTIPVPGLIHLAVPAIADYEAFFRKPEGVTFSQHHSVESRNYTPKYSWYRRTFTVPAGRQGSEAVITLRKSQYVTRVFINGMEVGSSMECYTPIEFPITKYLKASAENEVLIVVGDRAWLPSQAAGSIDKEKVNYLPGLWDDVFVTFTEKLRVQRALLLPNLQAKKVTTKLLIRSFYPPQLFFGTNIYDTCMVQIDLKEVRSGKTVASVQQAIQVKGDNLTEATVDIPVSASHLWTPDDPFLYKASIRLIDKGKVSDETHHRFGMREFGKEGKFFTLNGEKTILRGTNITLHRFFEDPECGALPWDRKWVKKLLADLPKEAHWNMMRICVGLVPDFWYDIADENGLMLQNEWLYWQNHGWDEQIRQEYTNWVWSDGNHPSIVIWDAINENWDSYIGNQLIPELKKLDPTRIWDSGFMTTSELGALDDMDEPHPYVDIALQDNYAAFRDKNPYPLGKLDYPGGDWQEKFRNSTVPQLVNEYGWMWLWRDGTPSKLTVKNYDYYLGPKASNLERQELQAYWLQLQTEWLRTERALAGVMHFCYLTNNYGFTGDAFTGPIAQLQPNSMLRWFKHCFAPAAVFINLTDERYMKHVAPHAPGSTLSFDLVGVNDEPKAASGKVLLRLVNSQGKTVKTENRSIQIAAYGNQTIPLTLRLPSQPDGYLLLAEFTPEGKKAANTVRSRRYLKVGSTQQSYRFYDL